LTGEVEGSCTSGTEKGLTMTANANLILAGVSGGGAGGTALAYFGATGTTAPTDASTALNAAFKDAGWCSEDGLTRAVSESSNKIKAYGTGAAVRTLVTESDLTFQLKMLETNVTSLAVYHRLPLTAITPAATTGAFSVTEGASRTQKYAAVFEMVDGVNKIRGYAPSVEVTDREEFKAANGEVLAYGVTLTAYVGSDGVAVHWHYAIPALAP
jgi:hypothetical protein